MTTSPTKEICLKAQGICKSYGDKEVIRDISVTLGKGELVGLLGISGIGKTTLFNILSGLELPDSGQVFLRGQDVTGHSGKVSYMQQKDLLLPFKTILDNVCIPLRLRGMDKRQAYEQASPLFSEFGIEGSQKKYPSQLSGGQRQRAALLRSYLFSGEVMLLDEPFSALDAITKRSLHHWFLQVTKHHGTSCLFITHDIDEAILLSDRIYIMSGVPGRITQEIPILSQEERGEDFTMSQTFLSYKRQILSFIKGETA